MLGDVASILHAKLCLSVSQYRYCDERIHDARQLMTRVFSKKKAFLNFNLTVFTSYGIM